MYLSIYSGFKSFVCGEVNIYKLSELVMFNSFFKYYIANVSSASTIFISITMI